MSYPLPTVRVANPRDPSAFMIINQDDLTADHEIWPEQEDGFVLAYPPIERMDPGERDVCAQVGEVLIARSFGWSVQQWRNLPAAERMELLGDILRSDARLREDEIAVTAAPSNLSVTKGAFGRFYVKRGSEKLSQGFATEQAANDELARLLEQAA